MFWKINDFRNLPQFSVSFYLKEQAIAYIGKINLIKIQIKIRLK